VEIFAIMEQRRRKQWGAEDLKAKVGPFGSPNLARKAKEKTGVSKSTVRARARPFTPKSHRNRSVVVSPPQHVMDGPAHIQPPSVKSNRLKQGAKELNFSLPSAHRETKGEAKSFVLSRLDRKISHRLPLEAMTKNVQVTKKVVPKFKVGQAVKLCKLTFHYDPPVESCKLTPYFLIEDKDGNLRPRDKDDDVKFQWSRGQRCVCIVCGKRATMQCMSSLKANLKPEDTFVCSYECMQINFKRIKKKLDEILAKVPTKSWDTDPSLEGVKCGLDTTKEVKANTLSCRLPPVFKDAWELVDTKRSYVPKKHDEGRRLKLEASVATSKSQIWRTLFTSPVMKAPSPPPIRRMLISDQEPTGTTFRVACFNVLAEIYATGYMYPYCPLWALEWSYRAQRILDQLLTYRAHIICLQEVQANQFKSFFLPKLSAEGFDGVFKRKTRESRSNDPDAVDGCAIFFDRKRFALRERHDIDFNQIAEMHFHDPQILRRMFKGNIAQILVLEELSNPSRGQICVANTHIYWDPEFKDVKLWQTFVLLQHLQRDLQHQKLPLILCGDFNSETSSAVYQFLSENALRPDHPIMKDENTKNVLQYESAIEHQLPLQSAYSVIGEPKFTNYTGHYIGTLDYIWFTHDVLRVVAVLEIDDEEVLRKHTALPSPQFPSDHLMLMSEFEWANVR